MASTEDICSEALGLIGENPISDINDTVVLATRCRQFYYTQRDALLRLHEWGFATRRALLTLDETVPVYGWAYAYVTPAQCLKILEVDPECDFLVEGLRILTNDKITAVRYIMRIEESGYFDSLFVSTLAAHLAVMLCFPLKKSAALLQAMVKLAEDRLSNAKLVDCQEGTPQVSREDSAWLDAR